MLLLPNGCKCSDLKVHPKTWNQPDADLSTAWFIHYRFYDPSQPKPKQVRIRGMNQLSDLGTRQQFTKSLIKVELEKLKEGWNPFLAEGYPIKDDDEVYPIHGKMGLMEALEKALEHFKGEACTVASAKSVLRGFGNGASALKLSNKQIKLVTRRDIKLILEKCSELNQRWSDNLYNTYRRNISMLYRVLLEFEAVEANPVKDIFTKRHRHRARATLTVAQRQKVSDHLRPRHYRFWLYMQIFFHSGSRSTELFQLRARDVNLEAGQFRVTVKKGRDIRESWRPIKDIAIEFWREAMQGAAFDDYLFGPGFKPCAKPMQPNRVSRLWKKYVKDPVQKDGLGIDVDFYSLKHLNLDETAAMLSIQAAAAQAGHTTPVITLKHYAQGEAGRQAERLKKVNNSFS